MSQFLIVYKKSTGSIVELEELQSRTAALEKRAKLEREYGLGDIEVVLLGARDRAHLERSHSRYFKSLRDLATA